MLKKGFLVMFPLFCAWAWIGLSALSASAAAEDYVTAETAADSGSSITGASSTAGKSSSITDVSSSITDTNDNAAEANNRTTVTNSHVVCLDPGHQSYEIDMSAQEPNGPGSAEMKVRATSGTQGTYTGIPEYALNLDVSLMLRDILEKRGYTVVMTRTDNETAISNSERALMAGNEGAEILVRIHANGEASHQQSGALAVCPSGSNPYVASLSAESERLSACVLNAYCETTGFNNLGIQYSDTMTGINWSKVPVTILEMGFMTHEFDDNQMANVEFRQIMAEGIAEGIDDYFGIDTSAAADVEEVPAAAPSGKALDAVPMIAEPVAAPSGKASDAAPPEPQPDAAMRKLLPQIQKGLPQENGKWAVYVHNMATDAGACMNSKKMQAASLIKLYIMGAVYEQYDALVKDHKKEEIDDLLKSMITVSDNDAANTLTEYLGDGDPEAGMKAVTEYCTAHGYTDSHMGRLLLHSNELDDNYTSVRDCGLFLSRIYAGAGDISSITVPETPGQASEEPTAAAASSAPEDTQENASGESTDKPPATAADMPGAREMFLLLAQQTRTNKIPAKLPTGVRVANKTGELADVENDVGIIYKTAGDVDLVVCFMSEGVSTPGDAQTAIADLSLLIYDFFNK